jgi:DNA polymerase III subunit gamma/tau
MSLFQKYRPKDFESLVWQEFVRVSLQNAMLQWKIVGAYLFYWSRGTWKTSVARILAKWLNCLNLTNTWNPCHECVNCKAFENDENLDIIEIDAASNTWVDNIRDLIERAQFQPNQSKYKVYIIDEVHMLSKWAFNALLKILEEPPVHVKFILATTEIHKIPDTIISRTQRYDFKRITELDIVWRLEFIAKSENISFETEALKLIWRLSKWWLRDAISLFEQYSIWWTLKLEYLRANLQLVWDDFLNEFIDGLITKNKDQVMDNLFFLREKWIDVKIFLEEIIFFLRDKIIASYWENIFHDYLNIFETFQEIYWKLKFVPNTFTLLEIWALRLISWEQMITETVKKEVEKVAKVELPVAPKKEEQKILEKIEVKEKAEDKKIETEKTEPIKNTESKPFDIKELIENVKKDAWKWFVAMTLRSSRFEFKNNKCIVYASNDFNFQKLNTPERKSYLNKKIQDLFGVW